MRSLRVLDLEGSGHVGDDELKRFLELLPRLRFLSLRGHREITRLPDSLSGLRHLQSLDIRGTSVVYVDLHNLQELQYIRAGISEQWTDDGGDVRLSADEQSSSSPSSLSSHTLVSCSCMPKLLGCGSSAVPSNGVKVAGAGIHHLRALHTLGAVNVSNANGNAILDEIYHLKQLKKLDVSGISRENSKRLCRAIINLESLSLHLDKEKHVVRWEDVSPPSGVRSLKVHGHVVELSARRIRSLQNLRKLSLEMTSRLFTPRHVALLGSVPNLHALRLRVNKGQDGELRVSSRHLFSKLHELEIASRARSHVTFDEEGTMVKLELLKARRCQGSVVEFTGLQHLVSLNKVSLKGSYSDRLREALQQQLAEHPTKPALVLN
jgi:Leucine-rich repeat (LRR) protein